MENINKLKKKRCAVNIAETVVIIIWLITELCLKEYICALPFVWGWTIFFAIDAVWGTLIGATVVLDKKIDGKPFYKNFGFYLCILWTISLIGQIVELIMALAG